MLTNDDVRLFTQLKHEWFAGRQAVSIPVNPRIAADLFRRSNFVFASKVLYFCNKIILYHFILYIKITYLKTTYNFTYLILFIIKFCLWRDTRSHSNCNGWYSNFWNWHLSIFGGWFRDGICHGLEMRLVSPFLKEQSYYFSKGSKHSVVLPEYESVFFNVLWPKLTC